jgi:hypothetical protein
MVRGERETPMQQDMRQQVDVDLVDPRDDADGRRSQRLLSRIGDGWARRAGVRKEPIGLDFDPARDDFLETLLPFHDHPAYRKLDQRHRQQILSCGWIIYNEKTVVIETAVVGPCCIDILEGRIPGLRADATRLVVCETLVDEAYHLLLVENANRVTRVRRGLGDIEIPSFNLVNAMNREKSSCGEEWQKTLVQAATSVVSEIFVSDYLRQLADCASIQAMNRATVAAHRHDELIHSSVFKILAEIFYAALAHDQQAFFAALLPKSVRWFADLELDVWDSVLLQLKIPDMAAIIGDCRPLNLRVLERIDYSEILSLAERIGILETEPGRMGFARNGLL